MEGKAMFCYQCEQAAKGEACVKTGACGKDPEVSALQDLLVYALKGLSLCALEGRKVGIIESKVDVFVVQALFQSVQEMRTDMRSEKYKTDPAFWAQVERKIAASKAI